MLTCHPTHTIHNCKPSANDSSLHPAREREKKKEREREIARDKEKAREKEREKAREKERERERQDKAGTGPFGRHRGGRQEGREARGEGGKRIQGNSFQGHSIAANHIQGRGNRAQKVTVELVYLASGAGYRGVATCDHSSNDSLLDPLYPSTLLHQYAHNVSMDCCADGSYAHVM